MVSGHMGGGGGGDGRLRYFVAVFTGITFYLPLPLMYVFLDTCVGFIANAKVTCHCYKLCTL